MKILVAYSNSEVAKRALMLARDHARAFKAKVFVMISMEGGSWETPEEINTAEESLEKAKLLMEKEGIDCEIHQVVQARSPGENIVWFARTHDIDLIFIGIEKKLKAQKIKSEIQGINP
jgi:nucleotide-binding universal stress UspA family protein